MKRSFNAPLAAAIAATLACATAFALHSSGAEIPGLTGAEYLSIDARYKVRGPRAPRGDEVVIVGLDDKLRAQAPLLFQRRSQWAALLDAISAAKPAVIAIDAFFDQPEVTLPPDVVVRVREARALLAKSPSPGPPAAVEAARTATAALDAVLDSTRGDEELAAAVVRAKELLFGVVFLDVGESVPAVTGEEPIALSRAAYEEGVLIDVPLSRRPPRGSKGLYSSLPGITAGGRGAGFVNVVPGSDGEIREMNTVIEQGGRYYLPLGLAAVRRLLNCDAEYRTEDPEVHLGDLSVPVDPRAFATPDQLGPGGAIRTLSAADVLAGRVPAERLAGKIVFVGFTDAHDDEVDNAFGPVPGVEIHATLAHAALHGDFLHRARATATLATIVLLGLAVVALTARPVRRNRSWVTVAGAVALVGAYVVIAQILFDRANEVVAVIAPVASTLFVAFAALGALVATEGKEKTRLRAIFSKYVSSTVVDRLMDDPARMKLGGERRELTVLFSDIRGFSHFSETLDPQVLSEFRSEYLTPMTDLVLREDGMLDKYLGDGLMAVYGAPLEVADHAVRSCKTALAMIEALGPLNARWQPRGLPEIQIGIGLNSGPMSVGNMGSAARFEYTVLGDAVNLGSRLETLTKEFRVKIIAGERTRELAGNAFVFRELDQVRVVGREGTVRIYELLGTPADASLSSEEVSLFHGALEAYRRRDWDSAESGFSAVIAARPSDGPAKVMLERVRLLRIEPPPEGWDGVHAQRSK
jgi:adenylate cyclase